MRIKLESAWQLFISILLVSIPLFMAALAMMYSYAQADLLPVIHGH